MPDCRTSSPDREPISDRPERTQVISASFSGPEADLCQEACLRARPPRRWSKPGTTKKPGFGHRNRVFHPALGYERPGWPDRPTAR